jgi:hypothetical protein
MWTVASSPNDQSRIQFGFKEISGFGKNIICSLPILSYAKTLSGGGRTS